MTLYVVSVLGVIGIIAAAALLGSKPAVLSDAATMMAAIEDQVGPTHVDEYLLGADGQAALAYDSGSGWLGSVSVLGDRFVVRTLDAAHIARTSLIDHSDGAKQIEVQMQDLTFPRLSVTLDAAHLPAAQVWLNRLGAKKATA